MKEKIEILKSRGFDRTKYYISDKTIKYQGKELKLVLIPYAKLNNIKLDVKIIPLYINDDNEYILISLMYNNENIISYAYCNNSIIGFLIPNSSYEDGNEFNATNMKHPMDVLDAAINMNFLEKND